MIRENSATFVGAWLDACSLWRLFMPHLNMAGSSFFIFAERPNFTRIVGQDTCIVQRCCTAEQFKFIQTIRQMGMTIVYDLDDLMWEVPKLNPAYNNLKLLREGFAACMQYTDVISVSTERLKKAVQKHVKLTKNPMTGLEIPIIVAENKMETRMFAQPVPREEMIVGWAGSTSHIGDLAIIEKDVTEVAKEHPEITFEFRGLPPGQALSSLPNFRFKLWTPVSEFCSRMPTWGWSIALAPLEENNFNAAKSNIKVLESAYCGIPTLASWVEPYVRFYSYDTELMWLLCQQVQWGRKLRELINDKARREELGRRAQAVLLQHYTWNDQEHEGWKNIFEAVEVAQKKVHGA